MRVVRYQSAGEPRYGIVEEGVVRELEGSPTEPEGGGAVVGAIEDVELLAPCRPTKVVAVGRNYASHVREMGTAFPAEPLLFLKGANTVIGPNQPAGRPVGVERFHFEGELAVVIGRRSVGLAAEDYADAVWGYTCANDLSIRDWQESDGQWARAKGADTTCPLGPWIETDLADPHNADVRTSVNSELLQSGNTSDLIFPIGALLAYVTEWITLEAGDVLLTGTPGGVGPVVGGDVVDVEISGIGRLTTPIVDRQPGR